MVTLELVLQIASYVAFRNESTVDRPTGRLILCIGDSLTAGLGAQRQEAYPARLEARLAERGTPWHVVNAGRPGQCSADILQRLPDLVDRLSPQVVVILVGWNDAWARPARLERSDLGAPGFPLRWRTTRLLAMLGANEDAIKDTEDLPFLGSWHIGEYECSFASDGSVCLGQIPGRWRQEGESLHITPGSGAPFTIRWRTTDRALEFALPGWHRFLRARPGLPTTTPELEEVADMVARGDMAAAESAVLAARDELESAQVRATLFLALLDSNQWTAALAHGPILEQQWLKNADPLVGEATAAFWVGSGRAQEATGLARQLTAIAPDRIRAWQILVDLCAPDRCEALAAELTAALARQSSRWRRAELILERAGLRAVATPAAAVADLLEARQLGIGSDQTVNAFARAVARGASGPAILAALDRHHLPPRDRENLCSDVRRGVLDQTEVLAILRHHLELATDIAQDAGARVVLLGYPFAHPAHDAMVRQLATARGLTFIPMVDAFAQRLASEDRAAWFVDPIHCTAKGYDLMATQLLEHLAAKGR